MKITTTLGDIHARIEVSPNEKHTLCHWGGPRRASAADLVVDGVEVRVSGQMKTGPEGLWNPTVTTFRGAVTESKKDQVKRVVALKLDDAFPPDSDDIKAATDDARRANLEEISAKASHLRKAADQLDKAAGAIESELED